MRNNEPVAAFDRTDPMVLDHLEKAQRVCLGMAVLIAAITLCAWIFSGLGFIVPSALTLMKTNTAVIALASAISLLLSQPRRSRRSLILSRLLALLVLLIAVTSLLEHYFGFSLRVDTLIAADPSSRHPGLMSPQAGSSFALLGVVLLFVRARKGASRHIADLFAVGSCLLVLVVVSGYVFGANPLFKAPTSNWTSPQALTSLVLLSFSAFARRAEYGSFKILVGSGIGSRIARLAAPILLVLPFLREAGRMRLLHDELLPQHYVSAILASSAAVLSFGLLLILAWRINGMEKEIQDLSLRDELTGLYNLRGFHLLAEQALHLAQRSQLPFSVLFIDLDHLKQINDEFGHKVGSEFLVETGALLQTIFRETDVVGRIGGDEFAVAGQFGRSAVTIAAQRIEKESTVVAPVTGRRMPLSLSIGYVTTKEHGHESLHDLLAQADKAMYEQKRGKKPQVR